MNHPYPFNAATLLLPVHLFPTLALPHGFTVFTKDGVRPLGPRLHWEDPAWDRSAYYDLREKTVKVMPWTEVYGCLGEGAVRDAFARWLATRWGYPGVPCTAPSFTITADPVPDSVDALAAGGADLTDSSKPQMMTQARLYIGTLGITQRLRWPVQAPPMDSAASAPWVGDGVRQLVVETFRTVLLEEVCLPREGREEDEESTRARLDRVAFIRAHLPRSVWEPVLKQVDVQVAEVRALTRGQLERVVTPAERRP